MEGELTIGVEQEDTMSAKFVTMIKVDGMISVQISTGRNEKRVSIPGGANVVGCVQHTVYVVLV